MSERLIKCSKCQGLDVEATVIHNPETQDMNAKATLRCNDCGHTFEGYVTSPVFEQMQNEGWAH